MRLAIVTCYKQPDYIRAQTLRIAVKSLNSVETVVVKNSRSGLIRYPEIIVKLIVTRIRFHPDLYVLTFRGYEILPIMAVLTWPKKLIYDEFINPIEWLNEPRDQNWPKLVPKPLLMWFYQKLLYRCYAVLADTAVHAEYSKNLSGVKKVRFWPLPVSTNETLFHPEQNKIMPNKFRVLYYGNMLPLHGLKYVLKAAEFLSDLPIEFKIIGGNKHVAVAIKHAQQNTANIIYEPWIDFKKLPSEIYKANLCLGGPFGGTVQANHVITGKTYQFLACEMPTIVGRNKASGLFKDKQNCLVVQQKNMKALADAIRWAFNNQDKLPLIAKAGRQMYESNFSNQILSLQLEQYLQGV